MLIAAHVASRCLQTTRKSPSSAADDYDAEVPGMAPRRRLSRSLFRVPLRPPRPCGMHTCVCVCVCVREREIEREREGVPRPPHLSYSVFFSKASSEIDGACVRRATEEAAFRKRVLPPLYPSALSHAQRVMCKQKPVAVASSRVSDCA